MILKCGPSIEEFQQFTKTSMFQTINITVAGDLDYAQTEKWVREYFSPEIPKGTKAIYKT